jgi:hypothetical protein
MMTTIRQRQIEIGWLGGKDSEIALLLALGMEARDVAPGYCERWLRIPIARLAQAIEVLEDAGARILEPEP